MQLLFSTPFPWRNDNRFVLHVDGFHFYPHMLDAINLAQHSIAIEMYLCASGAVFNEFRDALINAAQRGVTIRLLLDSFGSLPLNSADRHQLTNAGIQLKFYNPLTWHQGLNNLLRNHRKLLVVDQQLAFTGGAGLTDEFISQHVNTPAWHDVMLEIRGPVVNDWQRLFDHTWLGLRKRLQLHQPVMLRADKTMQPTVDKPSAGRVIASHGPQAHHVLQSLYVHMKRARQRIWIVTPYFMPSWNLRQRLIKAARYGVDTRVLVPGAHTDHPTLRQASRRYYSQLLHHGVRIFEYQPRFVHAKIALCDSWVSLGSTNFDHWSLRWNLDANQEIDDPDFAREIVAMLDRDFAESVELHKHDWQQRPWYQHSMEWLIGLVDSWTNRWR